MVLSLKCIGCGGFQIKLSLSFLEFVHIHGASADKAGFIHADSHSRGRPEICTDSEGELSPLWKQRAQTSRRKQPGEMGTGIASWLCLGTNGGRVFLPCWCLAELGTGRKLRAPSSSALLGIPGHKEHYLLGCAESVLLWCHPEQEAPVSLDILSAVLHPPCRQSQCHTGVTGQCGGQTLRLQRKWVLC